MEPELHAALDAILRHVDEKAAETQQRFDEKTAEIQRHVNEKAAEIQRHVDEKAEETQRHFDEKAAETALRFEVVAEALRGDVALVAEGVTALSGRLDRVEANLRQEIVRVEQELGAMIRFSYAELDRKIQALEGRVSDVESRLERLERGR
jgi:hypothetical protein